MDERIAHYHLIRELGKGGMGEVYLAEDTRLERQVALKLLSAKLAEEPEHRHRFMREARSASALNHPNACVIHEVGETEDGRPFIAMEFVEGRTLSARLQEGPIAVSEIVDTAIQVADALDEAHTKGIVHRDIKSANINVNQRGQVKVLDFGLAKRIISEEPVDGSASTHTLTSQLGAVIGTPAYMSPEQALGQPVDHRSDLFSLGVVLYELLTGRLPFTGSTYGEMADGIVHRQPEAIARFNYDVPPELERITLKCLAKSPDQRFPSAQDLLVDLRNLQHSLETEATSTPRSLDPAAGPAADDSAVFESFPAAQSSAVAGTPADKLAQSDVLITYARIDDQPITDGRPGWISQFHRNLGLRVTQLSGQDVMVCKQPDPSGANSMDEQLLQQVPEVKTVVTVLSPPFARAKGCQRLVETFWRTAEESGRLQIDNHCRILNVVKTPVERAELPPEIEPLFARLVPFEFFERDPQTGRLREFDEAFGETAKQRFYERVYDVAFEISQVLKHFGRDSGVVEEKSAAGKTVFLAATTSDLEPYRDQLRRELMELGHEVLPKQPLPLAAGELASVARTCLQHCDLAIHFVGEYYGLVPEATELSVVALQNQVAAELSAESGLDRLIWMRRGQRPRDERQASFIRELERDPAIHRGAELIVDTLDNLKVLLRSRWHREAASDGYAAREKPLNGTPRIYLICDQRDEQAIEPLEDLFYEQGIEVSLPAFDVDEAEVQKIHVRNLCDCDAAIIYYGAAGKHWVDFNIRDLQKATGYRDALPIPIRAVYLAPPFDRRKERFKSVSVDLIRQGDAFDPAVLETIIREVKKNKEGQRDEP